MNEMNILIVSEYFYPHFGGVEQVFWETGRRLASKGHTITVFTTSEPFSPEDKKIIYKKKILGGLISYFTMGHVTVVRLSVPSLFRRYLFAIFGFPCLLFLFPKVDVIHSSSNYTIAITCFIAGRFLNKPVTMSVWEIWNSLWFTFYSPFIGFFFWLYEKFILLFPFNYFITPSQFVLNQLSAIPSDKKISIPLAGKELKPNKKQAVELRKKYHLEKRFLFLYFGRFGKSKGVEILISSFQKIASKYPNMRLLLFISNLSTDNKQILSQLIQKKNKSQILLYSHIPEEELAGHLSMADCVVTPDQTISFGLSALEASYIGRPILTTTGGALPEVVFGKVVFVVPGSTNELAKGMINAYHNKFTHIPKKHFSWNKTTNGYERIFQTTLRKD